VSGFNLPTTLGSTGTIKVGSTSLNVTAAPPPSSITVAIPSALVTTGGGTAAALVATTNTVDSINNVDAMPRITTRSPRAGPTNADDRYIYVDDQSPTITVADYGLHLPDDQHSIAWPRRNSRPAPPTISTSAAQAVTSSTAQPQP